VKFGIPLGMLNPAVWAEVTEEADRLGFESIWMPEHLVIPVGLEGSPHDGADHPPIPATVPVFDVFTYLGHLSARTTHIRFGTHVYNIGLRHPFSTARAATTLDVLSGGRLLFGIGASWLRAEWEAVGLDFDSRGARVDEAIDVCRRLWTDDVIEHHGRFFDFDPVAFEPKPVQAGGPALHIGGDGAAALRRAATVGAGWIPMNHTLEELPASLARLAELCEHHGRDDHVEVTLGGAVTAPADVERYAEAGVDRLLVRPWQRSRDAVDSLRRFADQVLQPA
jgi:probable F420-dependent oxidoreductase